MLMLCYFNRSARTGRAFERNVRQEGRGFRRYFVTEHVYQHIKPPNYSELLRLKTVQDHTNKGKGRWSGLAHPKLFCLRFQSMIPSFNPNRTFDGVPSDGIARAVRGRLQAMKRNDTVYRLSSSFPVAFFRHQMLYARNWFHIGRAWASYSLRVSILPSRRSWSHIPSPSLHPVPLHRPPLLPHPHKHSHSSGTHIYVQ